MTKVTEEDLLSLVNQTPAPQAPPKEVLRVNSLGSLEVSTVEDTSTTINVILYGDSGVGKTRLCGSALLVPEMSPVLILDIEGGVTSLKHLYPDAHVIRIKNFVDLQKAYDALYDMKHPFKTVVIDSLTEAQKFGMYGIMEKAVIANSDRDPDLPGIQEWGKNTEQMRKFVRAFRDLPLNTIFTALRMDDKDKMNNKVTLPSLSGKLAREVSALVDEVFYMYIKNVQGQYVRLLLTQKTEEIVAKDRSDNMPAVVQEPTMQMIYDYLTHRINKADEYPLAPETVNE